MNCVFLDTETTDIIPGQILQLSYILTNDKLKIVKAKNFYFMVDQISPTALAVHDISLNFLKDVSQGKRFSDSCHNIFYDLIDNLFIGHNTLFDLRFLYEEFKRNGLKFTPKDIFCTMKYGVRLYKNKGSRSRRDYKWPKLEELLEYTGVSSDMVSLFTKRIFDSVGGAHDARFDVTAVYLICKQFLDLGPYNVFSDIRYCG